MTIDKIQRFKNKIIILLIIILLISLSFNYLYFKDKEVYEYKYSIFVNHLYFSIDHSLKSLDFILAEDTPIDQLDKEFAKLSDSLMETHNLLNESLFYLDEKANNWFFLEVNDLVNYGLIYDGIEILPFLDDDKIDSCELVYLLELEVVLTNMHEKMYSEETGQEDPDLNRYIFNEVIQSGDHDTLIRAYIDNLDKD